MLLPDNDNGSHEVKESLRGILNGLNNGNVKTCIDSLNALYAALPYERGATKIDQTEANFRNIVFVVFTMLRVSINVEVESARGVIDAIVETKAHTYVFEFKRDAPPKTALAQIRERGYAKRFEGTRTALHLVGVSFSSKTRMIAEWAEEAVTR